MIVSVFHTFVKVCEIFYFYCFSGTEDYKLTPCPAGTFGNKEQAKGVEDCQACEMGKYCLGNGNTTFDGVCEAGLY